MERAPLCVVFFIRFKFLIVYAFVQALNNHKKHEALSNNPPKMMSNPIEYRQAKADWQLAVSVAEGAMNYWGDVMSAIQASKGEQAVADNAEAEVVESEPQGVRPPKKKPSNSMSAQIERMADKYGEPTDLYHFVLKALLSGGYKFKWGDNAANGTRGLSSHLGLSGRGEMSRRLWLLNNQGMSPEAVAERIEANFGRDDVTTAEVLNEILDILRSMPSRQSMFDEMQSYYQELAQANDAAAQQEAWDRAILEDMAESRGFLSVEEMEAYEEVVSAELAEIGFTDEEWEKYSNFVAEQIIAEENERRNETAQSDEQGGSYGIRQGGGEVLPEQQSDNDRGDASVAERPEETDVSDDNADGASRAEQGIAEQGEARQLVTEAVVMSLANSGIEVVEATDAMAEAVLGMATGGVELSAKKRRALETASVQEEHQPTVVSSADGTKVLNNLDTIASEYEEKSNQPKTFLGDVAKAIGAERKGSGSQYVTFETKNGKVVTIRLSNHNAKVSNFDNNGEFEGISIVVSAKGNAGITNDGDAHIVEYYYDAIKLRRAEGKPLAEIVRSIKQALYSGEFTDTTGLAERQEVNLNEIESLRTPQGTVYGWTDGKKVYLTKDGMNPETPIHEYTHIWAKAMMRNNPEGWQSVKDLLRGTPIWDEVMNDPNYADIRENEDAVASEALSRLSGRANAQKMEEMAEAMIEKARQEGAMEVATAVSLIERMKRALREFWSWVGKNLFDIKSFGSVAEVTDRVLWDLVSGTDLGRLEAGTVERMGSRVEKRMAEIASLFEGRELTEEQRAVADVFGGKADNLTISVKTQDGNTHNVVMRQGNENKAGVRHSVFRHYGTNVGVITTEDIMRIPEVIANGVATPKQRGNSRLVEYRLTDTNGDILTVLTERKEGKEIFNDFYTNRKTSSSASFNTQDSARSTHNDALSTGKDSEEVGDVQTSEGLSGEILYRDQWDRYSEAREKIREITGARGYRNNSAYAEGVTEDGETWVIRVSDHPANIDNFDRYNEDAEYILSIVIDEEFDEREARRRHDPITNDYNRWQVVVDPRNINYETLSYGIERFKRTGNGIYVWDGAQERMFRPSDTLASVNEQFNEELEAFADGTHHGELHLGEPGEVLQASGLNASEMYITPRTLKTHLSKHGLSVDDIRNLPMALQNPLMVYEWGSKAKSLVVITQIPRGDQRITIAVKLERGGERLEVNEIASVHGKDVERVLSEMNTTRTDFGRDNLKYVDKEIAKQWLGLVPPEGTASLTEAQQHATKIIEKFENPTIEQENNAESGENVQTFADVAVATGEKLGVKVVVDPTMGSKGSYNLSTGEVRVNPNAHLTEADVERSVVHEVIGHGGMQALLGERFDGVCKMAFEQMSDEQVADIRRRHGKRLSDAEVGAEYMAETAERMADPLPTLTDSPYSDAQNKGRMSIPKQLRQLWERIKGWIREAVRRRGIAVAMTDADIRYMIATASRKAKSGRLQEMIFETIKSTKGTLSSTFCCKFDRLSLFTIIA